MLSLAATLSVLTITASVLGAGLTGRPSKPDSKIARNVLEGKSQGYCSVSQPSTAPSVFGVAHPSQPSGPIESTHCLYETVESLNTALYPELQRLVHYPFFRHYKVDLYRECPFWYENGFCMNRDCGVEAADEVSPVAPLMLTRCRVRYQKSGGPRHCPRFGCRLQGYARRKVPCSPSGRRYIQLLL